MKSALTFLASVIATFASAQVDMVAVDYAPRDSNLVRYEGGFDFREGVYFDFAAFKHNKPSIPLEKLLNSQGKHIADFLSANNNLIYLDSTGTEQHIDLNRVWGICDHDVIFVSMRKSLNRIGLMASLGYIDFDQMYQHAGSVYGYPLFSSRDPEQNRRFIDMETGALLKVNAEDLDVVLQHDKELKAEFDALPKNKQRKDETIFQFTNRYNKRHPLYFPK